MMADHWRFLRSQCRDVEGGLLSSQMSCTETCFVSDKTMEIPTMTLNSRDILFLCSLLTCFGSKSERERHLALRIIPRMSYSPLEHRRVVCRFTQMDPNGTQSDQSEIHVDLDGLK